MISKEKLESEFHVEMIELFQKAGKACGYWATRYLTRVRKHGGLKTAKAYLDPKSVNAQPTEGFLRLAEKKRLDLTVEALVLKSPWYQLFEEEELTAARIKLKRHGYDPN